MLDMIFAHWLAAATPAVAAQLELRPLADQRLEVSLCFQGSGQHVRYRLQLDSKSHAGTARSGQSGALVTGAASQCPLRNRIGMPADGRVDVELHWWIDDSEQPVLRRSWPEADEQAPGEPTAPPGPNEVVA